VTISRTGRTNHSHSSGDIIRKFDILNNTLQDQQKIIFVFRVARASAMTLELFSKTPGKFKRV